VTATLDTLPYGDTSGWSGSDTSENRARNDDASGITKVRRQEVIEFLRQQQYTGATWFEVAQALGYHHGQASGVLSGLHKQGHIMRLRSKRAKCAIYVHRDYVSNRLTASHGRERECPHCGGDL
jgi:hypothetical protein